MQNQLSSRLSAYLKSWHKTSTGKQAARGMTVTLTYEQFLALFSADQLASLQKAIDRNRLRDQQQGKFGYVLTWKSYAARSSKLFNADTAIVCSRMKSRQLSTAQKGDKLRLEHAEAISTATRGKKKSPEHRKAISEATKGQTKAPWSDARKAAARERALIREAAKRTARADQL